MHCRREEKRSGTRIKGITIKLDGDSTGLSKALSSVDKTLSSTQTSLKDVNRLLKLDPKNTELLAQKQKLLKEAIEDTEERLKTLKDANEQVKDGIKNYDAWKKVYNPIKEEIDETTKKVSELKTEMSDMTEVGKTDTTEFKELQAQLEESQNKLKALKKQAKETSEEFGNPISTDQYNNLQREIIETENQLKSLKEQAQESTKSIEKSFSNIGNGAMSAGDALKPVSVAATGLATAAIATVPATEELRTDLSKLDNNAREAGLGIDVTREAFEAFNVISDEVDSSVEATSNLLQAGFTESNLQKAVEGLSGAYLRFPDTLKIESLSDSLQETLATGEATGQFAELLDRLGIGAENFSTKLQTMTTEADKQNYALETLANAGLNDTYNEYLKNNEALVESKQSSYEFQEAMAGLAETLTPIITKVTELATSIINWFNQLSPTGQNIIIVLVAIMAVISPLLTGFGNVVLKITDIIEIINKFGGVTTIITKVGSVFTNLFAIVGAHPIIAIVTAIIAIIVTLYSKCEWFRDGVNKILQNVQNFFRNLGTAIGEVGMKGANAFTSMVASITNTVSRITNVVKNGFQGAIDFITSLPSKARGWGSDFMQGMINGIQSKITAIVNSVKNVANKIASYLHFSRPEEGPLHYYEEWMPDFMDGLSKGIYDNLPKVAKAAEAVAGTLSYGTMKTSVNNSIDPNEIYGAVRSGVSDGSPQYVMIDERSFGRGLRGMGVKMQ